MPRGARAHTHAHEAVSDVSHNIRTNFQIDTGENRLQSCPWEEQNGEECGGGTAVVL